MHQGAGFPTRAPRRERCCERRGARRWRRVRLHARGHALLGPGRRASGGHADGGLGEEGCCSAGSCCSPRARQLGPACAGGGPLDDVVLALPFSVQGEQLKSVLSDAHLVAYACQRVTGLHRLLEGLFASRPSRIPNSAINSS